MVRAVSGVSLDLAVGETLGLVGESGCGKSTLGKAILKLVPVSAGAIEIDGVDIAPLRRGDARGEMRRKVQMIFQDPYGSLNPRSTVGRSVAQPLRGRRPDARRDRRAGRHPAALGRPADDAASAIRTSSPAASASASASPARSRCSPKLIICDEPVSALDVSVRAQVINLLRRPEAASSASPTCSSATTCRWSSTSPTGWR